MENTKPVKKYLQISDASFSPKSKNPAIGMITKKSLNVRVHKHDGRVIMQVLLLLILVGIIIFIRVGLRNPELFPIAKVQVKATYQHVHPQRLQQVITPFVAESFFSLNVNRLEKKLLKMPWVYKAIIVRNWPDQILIKIVEQQPIAQWNYDSLLNVEGKIFTPKDKKNIPQDLPLLSGPDTKAPEVFAHYQQMRPILQSYGLGIKALGVDVSDSWHLMLTNGIELFLGHSEILTRLNRFAAAYPKIIATNGGKSMQEADLRYRNGFAIKWKI